MGKTEKGKSEKGKSEKEKKEPSFETALKRLEKVVEDLEKPEVTLDESLELFEEGKRLSAQCQRQLTAVEQRVSELTTDEQGKPTLREFEGEVEDQDEDQEE